MAIISLISIVQKHFKLLTPPPKVWVSSLSVDGKGMLALTTMKKLKSGCHFNNINHTEKFQITDPPKFGSLIFRVLMEIEYQPL